MSYKNNKSQKFKIPYATRFEIALCIALGCVNIAILALVCEFTSVSAVFPAIFVALAYLVEVAIIGFHHQSSIKVMPRKTIHKLLQEEGSIIIKNMYHCPV